MKDYFSSRQEELFKAYQLSRRIGHSVPTGNERELIAGQFLKDHLPDSVAIQKGVLIDQDTTDLSKLSQTTSPELDLALVMNHHPQLTFYGGTRLVFAESAVAVIEVKPELTAGELDKVFKHCQKVKARRRKLQGLFTRNPKDPTTGPSDTVPYYVVAFESKLVPQEQMEHMNRLATESKLTEEEAKQILPDGIFTMDPTAGSIVLKELGIHPVSGTIKVPPFAGAKACSGSLLILWLILLGQIEAIRLLQFPHLAYAKKLIPPR